MRKVESLESRVQSQKSGAVRRRFVEGLQLSLLNRSVVRQSRSQALDSRLSTLDPRGLTLIELMVVIVILMTLVGGVIPILSPNNDARKIREASRGLQTYILQAQARAARTGRSAGIAFIETSPGSGVALEVFQIETPPPFAGFSSSSSARFRRNPNQDNYTIELGEGYSLFDDNVGHVPPRFAKPGDLIEVGNHLFILKRGNEWEQGDDGVLYFVDTNKFTDAWIVGEQDRPFPRDESDPNRSSTSRYRIVRQPVNTSESPYTLPAGVAIDMHASGTEGGAEATLFARPKNSSSVSTSDRTKIKNSIKQVGIMFTPTGAIESVHYGNGWVYGRNATGKSVDIPITDASRVFLLLGRVENVLDEDAMSPENGQLTTAMNQQDSDEQLAEKQAQVNWMNLDSRWIVCDARSGRSIVTENAFVDARKEQYSVGGRKDPNVELAWRQVEDARQFAKQMKNGSGG